ncbi:MAG: zf-HC2 domain-containing protein, partial [Gemmatimonadota bacterium]
MGHLTEAELQAWIDRELDPAEHVRVTRHLEDCAGCRGDLQA